MLTVSDLIAPRNIAQLVDHDHVAVFDRLLYQISQLCVGSVGILYCDATANGVVVKVHRFAVGRVAQRALVGIREVLGEIRAEPLCQ